MPRIPTRKLVVLGDGGCGKTALLTVFSKGYFPSEYEPTVFENYIETLTIDNQTVELSLWDTAGQEDYDRLRALSYADTHVVMICFSVDSPVSMENIETKWVPEVRTHCPGVKTILCALKCDLRDNGAIMEKLARRGEQSVTYDEGLEVAKRIKATRYLECSAKENRGVQEAIQEAARVALDSRRRGGSSFPGLKEKRSRCIIL